jgi:hypothetical protein
VISILLADGIVKIRRTKTIIPKDIGPAPKKTVKDRIAKDHKNNGAPK